MKRNGLILSNYGVNLKPPNHIYTYMANYPFDMTEDERIQTPDLCVIKNTQPPFCVHLLIIIYILSKA